MYVRHQPTEAAAENPRVWPVVENLSDCFNRAPQRGSLRTRNWSRQQLRDMHTHLVRAQVEMAHQIMCTALVQLKACAGSEPASETVVASLEGEHQGGARGAERLRQLEEVQTDMAEQLDAAVRMLRMAAGQLQVASASAAAFGGGGLTIQQDENEGQAELKRLSGCAMWTGKQWVLWAVCVALMALGCAQVLPARTLSFRHFPGGGVCFALLPAKVNKWHCGAEVQRDESSATWQNADMYVVWADLWRGCITWAWSQ